MSDLKRKRDNEESDRDRDEEYFRSYADIQIHEDMINDEQRTRTYRQAILRNYKKIYGKTVPDIGAGTGILSIFCVHAGAKKVYAVEASAMAEQARLIVKSNNMSDRIEVIQGKVEDVELPEKVDVIVSEWMGYFLLYESMLTSVITARDKWLKKDGVMLPSMASLYLAPLTDSVGYNERLDFWDSVKPRYHVDMSCMKDYARRNLTSNAHVMFVDPQSVMARPALVQTLELLKVTHNDIRVSNSFQFDCFGTVTIHGFVGWFTVEFPCGTLLSTSPYELGTHWQQVVMYIEEPFSVEQGNKICGLVSIKQSARYQRFLDIEITHSLTSEDDVSKEKTFTCTLSDTVS